MEIWPQYFPWGPVSHTWNVICQDHSMPRIICQGLIVPWQRLGLETFEPSGGIFTHRGKTGPWICIVEKHFGMIQLPRKQAKCQIHSRGMFQQSLSNNRVLYSTSDSSAILWKALSLYGSTWKRDFIPALVADLLHSGCGMLLCKSCKWAFYLWWTWPVFNMNQRECN